MDLEEKKKLLYRPYLAPEKHYESDAEFNYDEVSIPNLPIDEPTLEDDTPKKIREDLEEIERLIKVLPEDLHFLGESIKKITRRTRVAWPDGKYYPPKTEEYTPKVKKHKDDISYVGHVLQKDNPELIDMPNLFPKAPAISIRLETPKTLVQIIRDSYNKDQIQLEKYYLQQLQVIMQKYFQQMLMTMADCGLSNINQLTEDFDGNYVKVPMGQGLEHLRDGVVRSQIARNQKTRLFKKTHSVDNTLLHLRSWHAAEKQRERYYGEKYRDSGTYIESHSNSLLRQARSDYDKAYTSSLYDIYKYLNSSVILTNDILEMAIKEGQAKAMMLKAGVNIFEKEPIVLNAEAGGIAGNSGQAGDGRGSGFDEMGQGSSSGSEKAPENKSDSGTTDGNTTSGNTEKTSGIKAPNGQEYSQNDIDYLTNQGYSKDDAIATLSKDKKYVSETSTKSNGIFGEIADRAIFGGGIGGAFNKKSSGGDILRNIAGTYIQNKINSGVNIGGVRIDGNGISYKGINYNGKAINYKGISYDGKTIKYKDIASYDGKSLVYKGNVLSKGETGGISLKLKNGININRNGITYGGMGLNKDGFFIDKNNKDNNGTIATNQSPTIFNKNDIPKIGENNKIEAIETIKGKMQMLLAEKEQLIPLLKFNDAAAVKQFDNIAEQLKQLMAIYKNITG